MAKILLVEDDRELADSSFNYLKQRGHTVQLAYTLADGLKAMERHQPDVIVSDLMLGNETGLDLLAASRSQRTIPDVLLVTAHPTAETASDAMDLGAYEYVSKPYELDELDQLIARILERRELLLTRREQRAARAASSTIDVVAVDPAMRETLAAIDDVASRTTTILLRGDTGTGKEVLSRYLHRQGPHPDGPFVGINCAAIPDNLLASELFGHEKGAFTGASNARAGAFERASGGTLLLDEIGDIPASTQVHLLRVLESREVIRVGGSQAIPVNPRLVAATHRNLEDLVRDGTFREDLYYRINVYPVQVPALRNRPADIPELVRFFLREQDSREDLVPESAWPDLIDYHWPGNVRELRNIVENIVIRSRGNPVAPELVRSLLRPLRLPKGNSQGETLTELEIRRIREALATSQGNKSRAATALGITRRKLYSRMKVLGMDHD